MKEDINKFLAKLSAVILVGLLAVVGILCLIGFLIGGRVTALHMVLFAASSAALSLLAAFVLFRNEKERRTTAAIVAFIVFIAAFCSGYGFLNELSRSNEYTEYQSTVTYVGVEYKQIVFERVYFTDRNGSETYKTVFQTLNQENYYDDGTPINVKEYQGGFGYPVYEISIIKE